jgi:hypothetical protein
VQPTNVELVTKASRIFIGRVVGSPDDRHVELEITKVIRGRGIAKGDRVIVQGHVTRAQRGLANNKFDFSRPRRGAFAGTCIARDYIKGVHYLQLLDHAETGWETLFEPFGRVNEMVDPRGDPWIDAVIQYDRIAELRSPKLRQAALEKLVARGKAPDASKTDVAIANDVENHFAARRE